MERSGIRFEIFFVLKWSKIEKKKMADFALQNMVETTLSDGLETYGQRVYS